MANEEQLAILRQGVEVWNKWREENKKVKIDLNGAELIDAELSGVNFSNAHLTNINLSKAHLSKANLRKAEISLANFRKAYLAGAQLDFANLFDVDLSEAQLGDANLTGAELAYANLSGANLTGAELQNAKLDVANLREANFKNANLRSAKLRGADLTKAHFSESDLSGADLSGAKLNNASFFFSNLFGCRLCEANLTGADLTGSNFVHANVNKAIISNANVYGVSIWDLHGEFEEQKDLNINIPTDKSVITVDNIKVAQFIYLLLNNKEVRDVINTLTSKTVLILGRFAIPERKAILDALRNKLREYDLLPIVFDFDRPADKDFTETIKTLAGISYFVIADITNPKSSPLELQATVPDYQIPFVPIIQEGESPFAMMVDLQKKYPWVLPTRSYDSIETLMSALKPGIIDPAVEMRNKLRLVKAQEQVTESLRDYVGKTL